MADNRVRVFLGGTMNESKWRDELISLLKVNYYDPTVDDWTPERQAEEIRLRGTCDYVLYVLTPKMTGVYAVAEVVDDSNKQPQKTLFCYLTQDENDRFDEGQLRSMRMVSEMVERNGGHVFPSIGAIAEWLNNTKVLSMERHPSARW